MFTDCVANNEKRRVTHQRVEQQKLFEPVTKWSGVLTPVDPGESLRKAIALACAPPPGPVHLDIDETAGAGRS